MDFPAVDGVDRVLIHVHADYAHLAGGEHRRRRQADIAEANDGNVGELP